MLIKYMDVNIRSYTQRNCNLECQSNYTLEKCKCIPYYLPRNKNITACGRREGMCVLNARMDMEVITGSGTSCYCLPGCFEIVFSESKSYGELSPHLNNSDDWYFSSTYFKENIAIVHFFFPTSQFSKQVKGELYGFTEILSNVGGLLGLCMGFSFLSIIEMLYYITIKLLCRKLLKNKRKKNKRNEEIHYFDDGIRRYPFLQ